MSKTLFRYIFWELLKIFLLASGTLAGVMSFGGLLRPLTRQGLGLGELVQMVIYLMPAMSAYSLPVAALFATTLVYGRLSADNELIAMRAGGISHVAAASPGILLGLIVAGSSLVMLCFVVPAATLRVERIIKTNVARVLATNIERNHEFELDKTLPVLSAQGARILPPDKDDPTRQTVVLDSPLIINSEIEARPEGRFRIPREFHTARRATVHIRPVPDEEEIEVVAQLEEGVSFPRRFQSATTGGVEATQFGPVRMRSLLAEKPKFMDLHRLRLMYTRPELARRVVNEVDDINRLRQQQYVFDALKARLDRGEPADFVGANGERHTLTAPGATLRFRRGDITISAPAAQPPAQPAPAPAAALQPPAPSGSDLVVPVSFPAIAPAELTASASPVPKADTPRDNLIRFETTRPGSAPLTFEARHLTLRPNPNNAAGTLDIQLVFEDATFRTGNDEPSAFESKRRPITLPMPPELAELGRQTAVTLRNEPNLPTDQRKRLERALLIVHNEVTGELNARAAFAVSCFILVLIGASLGMMFRSGHFLSAFAISVIPALICILLAVTGQHVMENIPNPIPPNWTNPWAFGIGMIWSGNVLVATVGAVLMIRLQRS